MEIYDPTYAEPIARASSATRDRRGDFVTDAVAFFSNSKPNAPELLMGMREKLGAEYGRSDFAYLSKDTASLAAPESVLTRVAEYDIAILALGDCGSCSSYCFQDSLELERRGVTTYIIVTKVFEMLVRAHARSAKVEPRLIVLDHPVAGLKPEDLDGRIDQAVGAILRLQPVAHV
jgi:hypothetical protein